MTAYLKKSFVYNLHYWIEQKLGIILIPLSEALDVGVLVIPFEVSGHEHKVLPVKCLQIYEVPTAPYSY